MRELVVTGQEFQHMIWPTIVSAKAKDANEFEVAVRVLRKLKKVSIEIPPKKGEEPDPNAMSVRTRKLNEYPTRFYFDEDEHRLLEKRMIDGIPGVSIGVAEEYSALLEKMKDAKEYVPPPPVEEKKEEAPAEKTPEDAPAPVPDDEEDSEK